MNLLEAYRELGALTGDSVQDRRREAAARLLLDELRRLAIRLPHRWEVQQDLPSVVLLRLVDNAAGGRVLNPLQSEGAVKAYLWTCLNNAAIDEYRRGHRVKTGVEVAETPDHHPDAESALILGEEAHAAKEEWLAALSQLDGEIVPAIVKGMVKRAGQDFFDRYRDLTALAEGTVTFDEVVQRRRGTLDSVARNTVQVNHKRTRERLLDEIQSLELSGAVSQERAATLRATVRRLRRRA